MIGFRILYTATLCLTLFASTAATEELLRVPGTPGHPGGSLVVALRVEPRTLNPVVPVNNPTLTVVRRMMADLVHIDRATQQAVPALAKSWSISPDGLTYTLELREGLRFSDGAPFDAEDVLFTFEVILDEKIASPHRDFLTLDGQPIVVRKIEAHKVLFELPKPYAVRERLFDSIPILPRHRLEAAYREGRFAEAWTLKSSPEQIAGLGPFRFKEYVPGAHLKLERNPYYWKIDSNEQRLPYLDEITFLFVPSVDAQVLRFKAGETHLIDRLSARNFALLERDQAGASYVLEDLGASLNYNFLFFNLNDLQGRELEEVQRKQQWFRDRAFREAVSWAIDREGIVRLVYAGRATPIRTHVTPGNNRWIHPGLPPLEHSPESARATLKAAGYSWDENGRLLDAARQPVAFTLITNASNNERMGIAAIVQEDLSRLGMKVEVAGLEFGDLMDRLFNSFGYEACVLGIGGGDPDPNSSLGLLTTGGGRHLWQVHEGGLREPWQTEINSLMSRQLTVTDQAKRRELYLRTQELVAANLPMIFIVSPNMLTGASSRLGNFRPSILDHYTLWNVDELFWRPANAP